jgi:hypothetical protein
MTHEQAFELVKRVLVENFPYDPEDVARCELDYLLSVDMSLRGDERTVLFKALEALGVSFPENVYGNFHTIRDVVDYVVKHKGANAHAG